jgi:type I restriction enzyme S subunit
LLNGWEQKGLFEIADITYGFPFASKMFSTEPTGTPVIRIRDILGNSTNTYTTESTDEKYIVKAGDILVGMDGDFHMCKWANKEAYLNQRVVRFRPKNGISKYFLFLALQEPIHYYNQIIVGTTVAHLGDSHLKSIRILVPDKKFLEKVKEALDPIYELEISLRQKNVNLRQTRDLLLPRLVSGEVDVSSLS